MVGESSHTVWKSIFGTSQILVMKCNWQAIKLTDRHVARWMKLGSDTRVVNGHKNIKHVWYFIDSPRQAVNLQPTLTDHVNIGPDSPKMHSYWPVGSNLSHSSCLLKCLFQYLEGNFWHLLSAHWSVLVLSYFVSVLTWVCEAMLSDLNWQSTG